MRTRQRFTCILGPLRQFFVYISSNLWGILIDPDIGDEDKYIKCFISGKYAFQYWENIDILGWSILHYAVQRDKEHIVAIFLEAGMDPNPVDIAGWPPLHYICGDKNGSVSIISALLHYGADTGIRGVSDGIVSLHRAANKYIAALLVNSGADVEAQGSGKRRPLHHAAFHGREDVVQLLLDKGAYTRTRDDYGRTPLHLAMICRHFGTISKLVDGIHGRADAKAMVRYTRIPLHVGAISGLAGLAHEINQKLHPQGYLGIEPERPGW